jgi:hypothetical protein
MSYGTVQRFASKKALQRAVEEVGADKIMVKDTSFFNPLADVPVPLSSLADTSDFIAGPDVNLDRKWYAQVKTKRGKITIV